MVTAVTAQMRRLQDLRLLVCDLFPPSLPEPYGASETENGNVLRAKGEVTTKGLSPGGGEVPS